MTIVGSGSETNEPGILVSDVDAFNWSLAPLVLGRGHLSRVHLFPVLVVFRDLQGVSFGASVITFAIVCVFEVDDGDALDTSGVHHKSLILDLVRQQKVLIRRATCTFTGVLEDVLGQEALAVGLVRAQNFGRVTHFCQKHRFVKLESYSIPVSSPFSNGFHEMKLKPAPCP